MAKHTVKCTSMRVFLRFYKEILDDCRVSEISDLYLCVPRNKIYSVFAQIQNPRAVLN